MPLAVSKTRGYGFPLRGSLVTVFSTNAPRRWTSRTRSMIPPDVPDATIIGLASLSGPSVTDRSAVMKDPTNEKDGDAAGQHRVGEIEIRDQRDEEEIPHVLEERPVPRVPQGARQDQRSAGQVGLLLLLLPQEDERDQGNRGERDGRPDPRGE